MSHVCDSGCYGATRYDILAQVGAEAQPLHREHYLLEVDAYLAALRTRIEAARVVERLPQTAHAREAGCAADVHGSRRAHAEGDEGWRGR